MIEVEPSNLERLDTRVAYLQSESIEFLNYFFHHSHSVEVFENV